jgi:hypothetical protein
MKPLPIVLTLALMILTSTYYPWDHEETEYSPVLLSRSDLPKSVFFQEAREFSRPGKLQVYNHVIFVVEKYQGIHVIDNTDPASPINSGFIHIPGCISLAVKNNVLFADNAIDLISVYISQFPVIKEMDRFQDVFPEHTPPDLDYIPANLSSRHRPANTIIVDWE